jgi:hypothetical protein
MRRGSGFWRRASGFGQISRRLRDCSDQPVQQPPYLSAPLDELASLNIGQKLQPLGNCDLSFDFKKRTSCHREELTQLAVRETPLAFCNIAWYGHSCSTELAHQTENFILRELRRALIDFGHQRHR